MGQSRKELYQKLDRLLEDLKKKVSLAIPTLGISMEKVPGEYWFFNPRLFNLSSWWEEVIAYSTIIHQSIVSYRAHDIHLTTLQPERSTSSLSPYLNRIEFERNCQLENAMLRLFAFREKVAWIVYELIGHVHKPIDFRNVSYSRVKGILSQMKSAPSGIADEALNEMRDIFQKFDSASARKLFEFRHGITHRISLRPDRQLPPLIVSTGSSTWDTVEMGLYRFRFFDHSTAYLWNEFATLTRRLAQLYLPWITFRMKLTADLTKKKSLIDLLHTGIGIHLQTGDLIVRCGENCRGWWGNMTLTKAFRERGDKDKKDVIDEVKRVFLENIPLAVGEKKNGRFVFIDATTPDGLHHLFIGFTEPTVEKYPTTIRESAIEIIQNQLEDPSLEYKWASPEEALEAGPIDEWCDAAKEAWQKYLTKQPSSYVAYEKPESNRVLSWIVFDTQPQTIKVKNEEGKLNTIILRFEESTRRQKTK